jgi:plasmid stabilization system protein ParE
MHKLEFAPAVQAKLDEIYEYIADVLQAPQAATSTVAGIVDGLSILKNNPDEDLGFHRVLRMSPVVSPRLVFLYAEITSQSMTTMTWLFKSSEFIMGAKTFSDGCSKRSAESFQAPA